MSHPLVIVPTVTDIVTEIKTMDPNEEVTS